MQEDHLSGLQPSKNPVEQGGNDIKTSVAQSSCGDKNLNLDSRITLEGIEDAVSRKDDSSDGQRPFACSGSASSSSRPKHSLEASQRSPFSPALEETMQSNQQGQQHATDNLWQRLKWGFILLFCRRNPFALVKDEELKIAIASTLEVAIMGSALALTAGLQMQEVVGGRGGYNARNGSAAARYAFVLASTMSFTLSFYSIITSSILLLSLSACPLRHTPELLKKFASWFCTPKYCTLAAALCLCIAGVASNFLALDGTIAVFSAGISFLGLILTIIAVITIVSQSTTFRNDCARLLQSETADDPKDRLPSGSPEQRECEANSAALDLCSQKQRSQPFLSPLSSTSSRAGFSFRSSRLPV